MQSAGGRREMEFMHLSEELRRGSGSVPAVQRFQPRWHLGGTALAARVLAPELVRGRGGRITGRSERRVLATTPALDGRGLPETSRCFGLLAGKSRGLLSCSPDPP